MLIKGEEADNIKPGDTFSKDGFPKEKFDYMLANPPLWGRMETAGEDDCR
ncbi:MAG: SAM-dependent DNA methyltransferase [Chitinispirillaceae bacterium]|nr:SAM-dependent DNA methyltransferase [Chitinispirillaceae bacterium]